MLKDILEGKALLSVNVNMDDNWGLRGRCASHDDPDLWFDSTEEASPRYAHLETGSNAKAKARLKDRERAKEMCRACPVRAECLRYAWDHSNSNEDIGQHGIWGGLDKAERTKLRNMIADEQAGAA